MFRRPVIVNLAAPHVGVKPQSVQFRKYLLDRRGLVSAVMQLRRRHVQCPGHFFDRSVTMETNKSSASMKTTKNPGVGATGSGSRPDGGKMPVPQETPDMHTLGRAPAGWLK
jgi:hypothetical protein